MELKHLKHGPCLLGDMISSCRGMVLCLWLANVFINGFEKNLNGMLIKFEAIVKEEVLWTLLGIQTVTSPGEVKDVSRQESQI